MILLIDNYDSFVFNLQRYLIRLGQETVVLRNDAVDVAALRRLRPRAVVLSPGPCAPEQAGCCLDVVRQLHAELPILGICLGHQTIAQGLGGRVVRSPEPVHGRASRIYHSGAGLLAGLPSPFWAGRYHSLIVDEQTLPAELTVTARTSTGLIMALEHQTLPVVGIQFHPESILSDVGYPLLAAFLRRAGLSPPATLPTIEQERPLPRANDPQLPTTPVTF